MSENKHTPLPWAAEFHGDGNMSDKPTVARVGDWRIVRDGNSVRGYDCHGDDIDDAAFIVRAVNSHQALVDALKHARDQIQHPDQMIDEALALAEGR